MRKLTLFVAMWASLAFGATSARTLHFNRANVPAQIPGPVIECITVFVYSDSPVVRAFRVTVTYSIGAQVQSQSMVVERHGGVNTWPTIANFLVRDAVEIKPAVVEPLMSAPEPVTSQ
jgi:hypothetical protein